MAKVVIAINNKNDARYLPHVITSINRQSFTDYEIVGIDAGSTDNSIQVYKDHDIRVVQCGRLNQAASVNKIINSTQSDYFCWINADDMYERDFLSSHVDAFEADKDVMIVYSDCSILWENGSRSTKQMLDLKSEFNKGHNPLMHPTTMIRRTLFDAIGLFDETITYPIDYEMWARAWTKGYKFHHIEKPTAVFRVRKDSLTSTRNKEIWQDLHVIHKRYGWEYVP